MEALKHGGIASRATVHIKWVDSETVTEENVGEILGDVDGILVPGGFGDRGIEGKIQAIRYAVKTTFHSWVFAWACSFPS